MKTLIMLTLAVLCSTICVAQNGINYKAIIKDGNGNVIANDLISVQFTILQGATQTTVYKENHTPTTDANGLIILNIGQGTPVTGTFAAIDWAINTTFLNTKINTGAGLVDMGTTEFKSVPYAINAETAANVTGLETIDEGNGIGWRLKGQDPNNFGIIGLNAVDISTSATTSTTLGATGSYSRAIGPQTTASGLSSTAMGTSTVASGSSSTAMGQATKASGIFSTAMGLETEATGINSTAMGRLTIASGDYAIAIGVNNIAFGENSLAMGYYTSASGDYATAMGNNSVASNYSSTAMGYSTEASGSNSTAMGFNTEASGDASTAMGNNTIASAQNSTAIGLQTVALGESSIAMGRESTASGQASTAMGLETEAIGAYSTAMGRNTIASGQSSTTMGSNTIAIGAASTAMGIGTEASQNGATAMGSDTTASGSSSTAMGSGSTASGQASTAMGYNTTASGFMSSTMGFNTTASSSHSLAIGRYNVGGGNATSWVETDPLFEVGFGTAIPTLVRRNALTILKNGKIGIGTEIPTTFLQVTNGYDASLVNGTGYFLIGKETSTNMVFDNNEILVRNNGATSNLYLQQEGGNVYVGGTLAHSSDRRLKKDITPLSYGLETILELNPVEYNWKNREQEFKSLGLIAQEVQPIIKNIVHVKDDDDKTLSVSYTELIPVLIKAIQEQQDIIKSMQLEVGSQQSIIKGLTAELEEKNKISKDYDQRLKQIESLMKLTDQ